jgi:GH15 family glucan-1,4-alpha-glucosidase
MYGLAGERRLPEWEIPWLPGYEGAKPVRIGNAAANQRQLDIYGEVMDMLFQARRRGLAGSATEWHLQKALLRHLETVWRQPDEGIWEVRGGQRHFTHSKVMCWVAFDRAVKSVEHFGCDGPLDHWRHLRQQIHDEICREAFDADLGSFVQSYGSRQLDASLLLLPLVGFLPAGDARMVGTVRAIERRLRHGGLVLRYDTAAAPDGLPAGEGAFLACSFWLADNLILQGRLEEGRELFEHLLGLCNDVGLLAEEYDPHTGRMVGNFPQAFSHVGLVNTALNLSRVKGPAEHRSEP